MFKDIIVERYWLNKLKDGLRSNLRLDKIFVYNKVVNSKDSFTIDIDAQLLSDIKRISRGSDVGRYIYCLTGLNILLHKYSREKTITLITPEFKQENTLTNENIYFIQNQLSAEDTIREIFNKVRSTVIEAQDHQGYYYKDLISQLQNLEDVELKDKFDVAYYDGHLQERNSIIENADILISFISKDDAAYFSIEYNDGIDPESIRQFAHHYTRILSVLLENLDTNLKDLELLNSNEKQKLLAGFNNTICAFEENTLTTLFEKQAEQIPGSPAVYFQQSFLTYDALNLKANALANYLISNFNIKPGDVVGINLPSSFSLLISILGVLKTGGIVLSIDPLNPAKRISYMLSDSNSKLLITEERLSDSHIDFAGQTLYLTKEKNRIENASQANPGVDRDAKDLAYIVYTSGSTGNPKGVLLTHKNLVNQFVWFASYFSFQNGDVLPQKASINFIDSITELLFPITLAHSSVYLRPYDDINKNTRDLLQWLKDIKTTIVLVVPSSFESLASNENVSEISTLREVVLGGEELKKDYKEYNFNVYNLYGNSECSSISTIYKIPKNFASQRIPIGTPIFNTQIYILDKDLNLIPPFVAGDIYIGGVGVSQGYLNNNELNKNKFIDHPFVSCEKLYRTGDIGRWLADGNIEFIGREDGQVQIRGIRIELGEIEKHVLNHPSVKEAVVIGRDDQEGNKYIVAYLKLQDNHSPTKNDLRTYLKEFLPDYMVPAYFILLEDFPLNSSGKIDRKALPDPEALNLTDIEYAIPTSEVQEKLVKIWQKVLNRERIGIRDNFFEIGGHSLRATQIATHIYKEFQAKVDLRSIITNPTIEALTAIVEQCEEKKYEEIPVLPEQEYYDLSHSQKRLWVLSQIDKVSVAYNMCGAYIFEGQLRIKTFQEAFQSLTDRHEILRTTFVTLNGQPKQKIHDPASYGFHLDLIDLREENLNLSEIKPYVESEQYTPFDLVNGPLLRGKLLWIFEDHYVFIFTLHHIISDGWSMGVLVREILGVYNSNVKGIIPSLPHLRIQYKEYSHWQQKQLSSQIHHLNQAYWKQQLSGTLPVLSLPTDYRRPAIKNYRGSHESLSISFDVVEALKQLSKQEEVSLFVILLSGLKALFYRYTGAEDIILGTAIAGREHPDLEHQIGFYVNTLALRTSFKGSQSFGNLLYQVRETTLGAFAHQSYPFDLLVEDLSPENTQSHSPLFDVMVILQNNERTNNGLDGITIREYEHDRTSSVFDLMFNIIPTAEGGLYIDLIYNTELYKTATIRKMLLQYEALLKSVVEGPDSSLKELRLQIHEESLSAKAIYVLDSVFEEVPDRVIGEVYLSMDSPDKTKIVSCQGKKLYKTGDQGYWIEGELEIVSPVPHGIYVAGRYELIENIEDHIAGIAGIRSCKIINMLSEGRSNYVAHIEKAVHQDSSTLKRILDENLAKEILEKLTFEVHPILPLDAEGNISTEDLLKIKVIDDQQIDELEKQLLLIEGISEAAAIVKPSLSQSLPIHEWDIFEDKAWEKSESYTRRQQSQGKLALKNERRPAYLNGGPVNEPEGSPITLQAALVRTSQNYPDQGIRLLNTDQKEYFISYSQLLKQARSVQAGLMAKGLVAGDTVIIQIKEIEQYFQILWGCILGGIKPVTVAIAPQYEPNNSVAGKLKGIWELLGGATIVASNSIVKAIERFGESFSGPVSILEAEALFGYEGKEPIYEAERSEAAFYQLSSGSTGVPKCIQETHRGVINHVHGVNTHIGFSDKDVTLCWIPFDHVGALIAFHFKDLYMGMNQIHISTQVIADNPLIWLDYIEKHKVTYTWAPNFGYKLVTEALRDSNQKWDLSSVRYFLNAGEQVTLPVIKEFLALTGKFGVRENTIQPCFGMAETCTGINYQINFSIEKGLFYIKRDSLDGYLELTDRGDPLALSFMSVGPCRAGVEIRIVNQENELLEEGMIGKFQVRSQSVTPGYLNNEQATREALVGEDWFNTGDLGFILNGELAITGREKEMIIIRGTHYYYYELEDAVNEVEGIEPTYSGSCFVKSRGSDTEELVIFFSTPWEEFERQLDLIKDTRKKITNRFGISPRYLICIKKEQFPKTTSGKIQRAAFKQQLETGQYDDYIKQVDCHLNEEKSTLPGWFYKKIWKKKRLKPTKNISISGLAIFSNDDNWVNDFRQLIGAHSVIQIKSGEFFIKENDRLYLINEREKDDYKKLLNILEQEGVNNIIHAWSYTRPAKEDISLQAIEELQHTGTYSVLYLLQAQQVQNYELAKLLIVTSDGQAVEASDHLDYGKATLQGLIKTAMREIPALNCSHIDLPYQEENSSRLLYNELIRQYGDEEISYRSGTRYVRGLTPINLAKEEKTAGIRFKQGGFYLITGGLGGIGTNLSSYLLRQYQTRLLIVGRTDLASSPDKQNTLEQLQTQGGEVVYQSINIKDGETLATAVEELQHKWGQLDGILHLAGADTSAGVVIASEAIANFENLYETKVWGSLALDTLLETYENCWMVSFSSVNAYFGGATMSAYASANSFLDHYMQDLHKQGRKVRNLQWSMWDSVGMSASYSHLQSLSRQKGFQVIEINQGLRSMEAVLASGLPEVMIGIDGNNDFIRNYLYRNPATDKEIGVYYTRKPGHEVDAYELSKLVKQNTFSAITSYIQEVQELFYTPEGKIDKSLLYLESERSVSRKSTYIEPETEVESALLKLWKKILKKNTISVSDNFFESGGDSLKGMQLVAQLNKAFKVKVELNQVFNYPTIRELSNYIDSKDVVAYQNIESAPSKEYYELSYAQRRLWILDQLEEAKSVYNIPGAFELTGTVNKEAFAKSFQILISRHESLRTKFVTVEGEPKQKILEPEAVGFKLELVDLQGMYDRNDLLECHLEEEINHTFNLSKGPLLRAKLIHLAEDQYIFILTLHHIICDGWSIEILVKELQTLYNAYRKGEQPDLPPLAIHYKDFATWQFTQLASRALQSHRKYWMEQFKDDIPVLDFPTDYTRPAIKTYNGKVIERSFNKRLTEGLEKLSQSHGVSLYMTLLTAIKTLIYRYTGQEDIILGSPIAGRDQADLQNQIGFYINMLPIRTRFSGTDSFLELLSKVRKNTLEAYEHQQYPFDLLVEDLSIQRDISRSVLYDAGFTWHSDMYGEELKGLDFKVEDFPTEHTFSKWDFWIYGSKRSEEIYISLEFNTDLYHASRMERLLSHLEEMLGEIIKNIHTPIQHIDYLPAKEKTRLLQDFNSPYTQNQPYQTLQELFEAQVYKNKELIAVTFEGKSLTYGELNIKANQLAHYLRKTYDIRHDDLVGLLLTRSELMIVAILGIIKAGGAYVPIDPEYPRERKKYMLNNALVKVLLTDSTLMFEVAEYYQGALFALDIELPGITESKENPDIISKATDLAYVIYTSGSTGLPKGVAIEQKSVIRLVRDTNYIQIAEGTKLLQTGALTFDATTFEIWGMLLNGGELHLLSQEKLMNVGMLGDYMRNRQIDMMWFTASWFNELADTDITIFNNLKCLLVGGDKLSSPHINKLRTTYPNLKIINGYGPTENTTFSICHEIKDLYKENIPIGKPITNSSAYILDAHLEPVPVGVVGEIFLGGNGLARGYWQREDLTREKFIYSKEGERLYRTGDWGRYLSDGTIEFKGRKDAQVKLRGYRIELGEIEFALLKIEGIDKALVRIIESRTGNKQLIAYFTGSINHEKDALYAMLSEQLPQYMIPAVFLYLESFPLTVNGKIDYNALPDPSASAVESDFTLPSTETEEKLAVIWKDILSKDRVSANENFFVAGGDSIKAIRMISKINKALNISLEVKDVFIHPTLSALAAYIGNESLQKTEAEFAKAEQEINDLKNSILEDPELSKLLPVNWEDFYPMSDIEEGMIYHSLLTSDSGIYHDQMVYQIEDADLNFGLFQKAVKILTEQHSILRTSFDLSHFNCPMQIVHRSDAVNPDVEYADIREYGPKEQQSVLEKYLEEDRKKGFDLNKPGVWHLRVFRLTDKEYSIFFIFHHAILDGWSEASIITELTNLYYALKEDRNFYPAPLKACYKDYIIDQHRYKKSPEIKAFWQQYLTDYDRTGLPFGKSVSSIQNSNENRSQLISLSEDLKEALLKLSERKQISVKHIFLTAFNYLMALTVNSKDVTIGLVTNGRPQKEDGDKVLGCFLNTVPFRVKIEADIEKDQFLESVNKSANEIRRYDRLSLVDIVKTTGEETTGKNPFFDVIFNYIDFYVYDQANETVNRKESMVEGYSRTNTIFDFHVNRIGKDIFVLITYLSELYDENEISKLSEYYVKILEALISQENKKLTTYEIIGKQEADKLLYQYNNTLHPYSEIRTVVDLFEVQAAQTPLSIALFFEGKTFTYKELNEKSNRLAHYLLKNYQSRPGDLIGSLLSRSEKNVMAILAIMKTGGCYVPIDPEYPQARIDFILQDIASKVILTEDAVQQNIQSASFSLVSMDGLRLEEYSHLNPGIKNEAKDPSYVIYTSGSTGNPKGVVQTHLTLFNLIEWQSAYSTIAKGARQLQYTSFSFDVSLQDVYFALGTGGALYVAGQTIRLDFDLLKDFLISNKIEVLSLPFSVLSNFFNQNNNESLKGHSIKDLITSGEQLLVGKNLEDFLEANPEVKLHNHYGPSETHVVTSHTLNASEGSISKRPPIGRPVSNTRIYILNENKELVPQGVIGDIYIGGYNLANGYLNNDELTRQKFSTLSLPYGVEEEVYKSGDLGKWLADGSIEYVGRKDNQIKIKGFRVELGEIQSVLLKQEDIKETAVLIKKGQNGEHYIVAYFTGAEELDSKVLRKYLSVSLPDYMIPSYFVRLEQFPLTSNGKINEKALPEINDIQVKKEYIAPRNEVESKLAGIWERVLEKEKISVLDDFFELGGHSLHITRVVSSIYKELGKKLELKALFEYSTVEHLAHIVGEAEDQSYQEIPVVAEQEFYSLSHSQKRLWALSQTDKVSTAYNMCGAYIFEGELDLEAFEKAFHALIARHEILRTTFVTINGEPRQKIRDTQSFLFKLENIDLREQELNLSEARIYVEQEQNIPFDLVNGPLIRARLLWLFEDHYVFIFTLHHIISDGWSMRVLVDEVLQVYNSYKKGESISLPELRIQYKDYSNWQQIQLSGNTQSDHQQYWKKQFSGSLPVLSLPADYSHPAVKRYLGSHESLRLNASKSEALANLARQEGGSLFMVLLSAINALFYRYTGEEDIILGTAVAGREHPDLEHQIGFYVNTLALRSRFKGTDSFRRLLQKVKETTLNAYAHQNYPFDLLIEGLSLEKKTSHSPLFDVMVLLQNNERSNKSLEGITVREYENERFSSVFELMFNIIPSEDGLYVDLIYDTDLYRSSSIKDMLAQLEALLDSVVKNADSPLKELRLPANETVEATKEIYVLDSNLHAVPDRVIGEIYLSENYKGNIPSSMQKVIYQGINLYKTGDEGRWLREELEITSTVPRGIFIEGHYLFVSNIEERIKSRARLRSCKIINIKMDGKIHTVAHAETNLYEDSKAVKRALKGYLLEKVLEKLTFEIHAALPLDFEGNVSVEELLKIRLIEDSQIEHLEEHLLKVEGISAVAAIAKPITLPLLPIHEWDIFEGPVWEKSESYSSREHGKVKPVLKSNRGPAYLNGGPVNVPEGSPDTLQAALIRTSQQYPDKGIRLLNSDLKETFISYGQLLEQARRVQAGLKAQGLEAGDTVILQIKDIELYFQILWGCILGGIKPVTVAIAPVYEPGNNVVGKLKGIWELLGGATIVASDTIVNAIEGLSQNFGSALSVLKAEDLFDHEGKEPLYEADSSEVLFYQLSSGSTGVPKCIQETHEGVINHIHGVNTHIGFSDKDITLCWIPFDHVGALIAFHFKDLYMGMNQIHISTQVIADNPLIWLDYIEKYKVSYTWAPNFGYKLVTEALKGNDQKWDLSSVRYFLNAGEQVTLPVIKEFLTLTEKFGVRENTIQPCFGMAETCTGVNYQINFSIEKGLFYIKRDSLGAYLEPTDKEDPSAFSFMSVGPCRAGVEIRIVNQENELLEEGMIGKFQIRSKSVTPGYLNNEPATREALVGEGWFNTGDLGFILNGELAITGREKEMIIIRGTHYYYYELEDLVNEIQGVEPTFAGSCFVKRSGSETEELVVFFSSLFEEFEKQLEVIKDIRKKLTSSFGISPRYLVCVTKESFPKTTSGKIQRTAFKQQLESGLHDDYIKQVDKYLNEEKSTLPAWFYKKVWKKKKLLVNVSSDKLRSVAVFSNDDNFINELRQILGEASIIQIKSGEEFTKESDHLYRINEKAEKDYIALLSSLRQQEVSEIIHGWSYTKPSEEPGLKTFEAWQSKGTNSILYLLKAIHNQQFDLRKLWVVSSESQELESSDSLNYGKATLHGLIKTAIREIDSLSCSHVDLPYERLLSADLLAKELIANQGDEEISYRSGVRYVSGITSDNLKPERISPGIRFKKGGFYLVTGGLGGIGTHICEYLLSEYEAKLLIVGRTLLASSPGKQNVIEKLQSLQGQVLYQSVNVNDIEALSGIVEEHAKDWGQPDGILQLAGVNDSEGVEIRSESIQSFERLYEAKVWGSIALGALLEKYEHTWMISFSSVNGYFGGATMSAYSSASSFLDNYMDHLYRKGKRVQNLIWSMWDAVGMSASYHHLQSLSRQKGFHVIGIDQGLRCMEAAMSSGLPHVMIGLDGNNNNIKSYLFDPQETRKEINVYYVKQPGHEVDSYELSRLVKLNTPYGIQSYLQQVEELVYTEEGEVDRSVFYTQNYGEANRQSTVIEADTGQEKQMAELWKKILKKSSISMLDSFFELGGDSLKGMQLVAQVNKTFKVKVELNQIFTHSTIRELCNYISRKDAGVYENIEAVPHQEYYELSHAQKRLWVLDQLEDGQAAYNIPNAFELKGDLNKDAFEKSFETLIQRHESLRTIFTAIDGEPKQKVLDFASCGFRLHFADLREKEDKEYIARELANEEANQPFNLSTGPLLRTRLIRLEDNRYLFLFTLHHIVSDGWSMEVLVEEILTLYDAYRKNLNNPLHPLRIQYKDYAVWHRRQLAEDKLSVHRNYWVQQFEGDIPILDLPTDYKRPDEKTFKGASVTGQITKGLSEQLNQMSKQHEASLYMLMLAALKVLLYRYTGQQDITLGSPTAGRDHADLENQIGFYVNMLPLRTRFSGSERFDDLLKRVSKNTLSAYNHQIYPYDQLVEELQLKRDLNKPTLYDAGFTWHSDMTREINVEAGLDIERYETNFNQVKAELWFHGKNTKEGILFTIEYNAHLFSESRMNLMKDRFINLLSKINESPQSTLDALLASADGEFKEKVDNFDLSLEMNF